MLRDGPDAPLSEAIDRKKDQVNFLKGLLRLFETEEFPETCRFLIVKLDGTLACRTVTLDTSSLDDASVGADSGASGSANDDDPGIEPDQKRRCTDSADGPPVFERPIFD